MIVSGGFTDDDWKTFPVWAMDISSAEKYGNGLWINLTPPTMTGFSEEEADSICRIDYWDDDDTNQQQPQQKHYSTNVTTSQSDSDSLNIQASNSSQSWDSSSLPCTPSSRMGHLSVQHNDYLYVFGGLLYDRHSGVFFQPKETHVYRLPLLEFFNNNNDNSSSSSSTPYQWQRITSTIQSIPHHLTTTCNKPITPQEQMLRGEYRGGLWEKENKVIIFGGLRVDDIHLSTTKTLQVDTTLGDVWVYDFKSHSWELLFPSPCTNAFSSNTIVGNDDQNHTTYFSPQPLNRTAHAVSIVDDELIVYGGMTNDKSSSKVGQTSWIELDDVWIFHLQSKTWSKRTMYPDIPRCYHSIVAWKNNTDTVFASFGGYRTVMDSLTNQVCLHHQLKFHQAPRLIYIYIFIYFSIADLILVHL